MIHGSAVRTILKVGHAEHHPFQKMNDALTVYGKLSESNYSRYSGLSTLETSRNADTKSSEELYPRICCRKVADGYSEAAEKNVKQRPLIMLGWRARQLQQPPDARIVWLNAQQLIERTILQVVWIFFSWNEQMEWNGNQNLSHTGKWNSIFQKRMSASLFWFKGAICLFCHNMTNAPWCTKIARSDFSQSSEL